VTAETYGQLQDVALEVRALIKAEFPELKEKDIKEVLDSKIWLFQKALMEKAQALQAVIGTEQFDDFNQFDEVLKKPSSRPTSSWMPKRRNSC
jgi:type I restriction enzyme M protein